MGSFISQELNPWAKKESPKRKRKRKENESDDTLERKKKRLTRSKENDQLIFKELFEKGVYSDISVKAMGRVWKLHKVHLRQLPYFASMFSGDWKECNEKEVELTVVDQNITAEGIHFIFESLYRNITISHDVDRVPLMAAASMFGSERIMGQCALTMTDTLTVANAVKILLACEQYGCKVGRAICLTFILAHIVHDTGFWDSYTDISPQLMEKIVTDVDLAVIPNEMAVYSLLVRWMYKQLRPDAEPSDDAEREIAYFQNLPGQEPFLCTPEGSIYKPPFEKIRLPYVVTNLATSVYLKAQKIIPTHWITSSLASNYLRLTSISEGVDSGPQGPILEDNFGRGIRLGVTLTSATASWTWPHFLTGVPLSFSLNDGVIYWKRLATDSNSLISNVEPRPIKIKMRLSTATRILVHRLVMTRMEANRTHELLRFPYNATYPLYFCVELLLHSSSQGDIDEELGLTAYSALGENSSVQ